MLAVVVVVDVVEVVVMVVVVEVVVMVVLLRCRSFSRDEEREGAGAPSVSCLVVEVVGTLYFPTSVLTAVRCCMQYVHDIIAIIHHIPTILHYIRHWHEGSVNLETNAGTHTVERAIQEAHDLNIFFSTFIPSTSSDKTSRIKARTASF